MGSESADRQRLRRAFWAGFFSVFSLDITGRTQARMIGGALGADRSRTTREILGRSDAEALAADAAALRRDREAVMRDLCGGH